jgi:hypothetical protein
MDVDHESLHEHIGSFNPIFESNDPPDIGTSVTHTPIELSHDDSIVTQQLVDMDLEPSQDIVGNPNAASITEQLLALGLKVDPTHRFTICIPCAYGIPYTFTHMYLLRQHKQPPQLKNSIQGEAH